MHNNKEKLWSCTTSHEIDTDKLIESRFCNTVTPYVLFLDGELGSGKTYVCKKIAKQKNINNITSSSFSKMNIHSGDVKIIHADFYNISDPEGFLYNEICPQISQKSILLAEWLNQYYPLGIVAYKLEITVLENNKRKFSLFKLY